MKKAQLLEFGIPLGKLNGTRWATTSDPDLHYAEMDFPIEADHITPMITRHNRRSTSLTMKKAQGAHITAPGNRTIETISRGFDQQVQLSSFHSFRDQVAPE